MSGNRSIGHDARGGHLARAREALDRPTGPAYRCAQCGGGPGWHSPDCLVAHPELRDHPTGPATAMGRAAYRDRVYDDAYADGYGDGAAAERARILAALPEALRELTEEIGNPGDGWTTYFAGNDDEFAAALAAAIEAQLSREPGEEG